MVTVVLARPCCLGLRWFVLLAVSSAFGELEQAVETTAMTTWCSGCGVAPWPHGRRPVRVRDLPSSVGR